MERYEQLRRTALSGDPGGWRSGLAVLQHRGVAAWLGAWRAVPAAPAATRPARRDSLPPNGSADGLVHALAGMALGALAGG
ncbi:MAG TPA: hypothetical protein VII33_04335 [Nakamurella sp.]